MSKKEIKICQGYNKPKAVGFGGFIASHILKDNLKCSCKAILFENNKWWCKRHAPSEKKKREDKSWKTYIKRIHKNIDNNTI